MESEELRNRLENIEMKLDLILGLKGQEVSEEIRDEESNKKVRFRKKDEEQI